MQQTKDEVIMRTVVLRKAILHFNNEITSEAWLKTNLSSRRSYLTQASPSSFSEIPTSGLSVNMDQENFTLDESEAGQ
jgi:3-hydroxyisobutyrate dehydrogenase